MNRLRLVLLVSLLLTLSGCSIDSARLRVAALVLLPFLLLFWVLWFLYRRRGDSEEWDREKERFPDCDDDDDNEDHYLM